MRALASLADVTLMIVEWNKTDAARVAEAIEGLDPEKVSIIFNKVDLVRYARFAPVGPGPALAAA
ncbi:MAG: hypothetical protein ABSE69_17410 [Roseiarcus sp.]